MNKYGNKLIIASGLILALFAMGNAFAATPVSQDITNARQESQIWTTYALSPYLRADDLNVSVQDGKATLTGTVEEEVNKELAQEIALGVSGIKDVDNQIVVAADYTPPKATAARSYGEVIDDVTITSVVKSKLLWSKHSDGLATSVETKSGKVTLRGTADTVAAKEVAGRLAMDTNGVQSVDNQLMVAKAKVSTAASVKNSAQKAGQEIADGWITTKVKSTFAYSSNVSGSDISVSTSSGIVTLTGKVRSGAERALAVELAQNVRGVKSVQAKSLTF